MISTMRKCVVAAGAAALLSSQVLYAAPVEPTPTIDPLVALSVLGSAQSRAAVCGHSATCGLPMTTGASAAATSPAISSAAAAAAAQRTPRRQESRGLTLLFAIAGGMVLIAVLVAVLAGDKGADEPISPA